MLAKYSWAMGSLIITLMGFLHLYITFFSNRLYPRNKKIVEDMKTSQLILSDRLTLWKSWIGFNATHSSGVIFIGLLNLYVAAFYFDMLASDQFLRLLTILTVGFYVWIARKYWFKTVFILLSTAWFCFIMAYILILLSQ